MDIGKESSPYVIEPLVDPVPGRVPAPAPDGDPLPNATPAPERERETVQT